MTKTAAQVVVFWTTFLVLLPWCIVTVERITGMPSFAFRGQVAGGAAILAGASVLGLASAWAMCAVGRGTPLPLDCPPRLVTAGPYRVVRNPMAVAGLAQAIGVGVALGSWGVLAYTCCGGILWHAVVRPREEEDLRRRFGAPYERYHADVRCWIPRWPPARRDSRPGATDTD